MKIHLFTFACWAVPALGFLIACSRKPAPTPPPERPLAMENFAGTMGEQLAEAVPTDAEEVLLELDPAAVFHFHLNSAEVGDAEQVRALAERLRGSGDLAYIIGHGCPLGEDDYNLQLGERRAQAVRRALEAEGVPRSQMETLSRGEAEPVTRDQAEYWKNRRVYVEIVKGVN